MYYLDPHIHMVSRTTDDYEILARMGCVGMSEPAFWAGYDRGSVDGFRDYFEQLPISKRGARRNSAFSTSPGCVSMRRKLRMYRSLVK